jgi:hypothetical protein
MANGWLEVTASQVFKFGCQTKPGMAASLSVVVSCRRGWLLGRERKKKAIKVKREKRKRGKSMEMGTCSAHKSNLVRYQ